MSACVLGIQQARDAASSKGASLAPRLPLDLKPITVIVGYGGVGKTNLAINLAMDAADEGYTVTLVDLDIVNPYFRSSEYRRLLEDAGVTVVAPLFAEAGSNLDLPMLSGKVDTAITRAAQGETRLIVDAGGDDVGAQVLGRFSSAIEAVPHDVFYVLNRYRDAVADPSDAIANIRDVEVASRLRVTGLVNNTHLKQDTDAGVLAAGLRYAHEVASVSGLPLVFSTVPPTADTTFDDLRDTMASKHVAPDVRADFDEGAVFGDSGISDDDDRNTLYPVSIRVETPWGS